MDANDQEVGRYTGTALAGQTVKVLGDTVKVIIKSDDSGTDYGFEVVSTNPTMPLMPTSVTLDQSNIEMPINTKRILKATVLPENAIDTSVRWESSNSEIAFVKDGVVSAREIGETTIRAYTYSDVLVASCKVKVSKVIDGLWVEAIPSQMFTGKQIKPSINVYAGDILLTQNKDYKVKYMNNINVGNVFSKKPPTVMVMGVGNYKGSAKSYYEILPQRMNTFQLNAQIKDVLYSGKVAKSKPILLMGDRKLRLNKDYTLEYVDESGSNCIGLKDKTTAIRVIVTGIGNYKEQKVLEYQIIGKSIEKAVVGKIPSQSYTGSKIVPKPVVRYKNGSTITSLEEYNPITKTGDYSIEYSQNIQAGTAKMLLIGKNEYGGTKSITFKITPKAVNHSDITVAEFSVPVYSGAGVIIKPVVSDQGVVLTEGIDYTLSYKNNRAARNSTSKNPPMLIIKGKGNYNNTNTIKFTIVPKSISDNDISIDVQNALYNPSKAAKGKVVVKADGKLLKENRDYKLFYADNADLGPATVRIQGIGNYEGEITATYQVLEPILVTDAKVVVQEIADATYSGKAIKPSISVSYNGTILRENIDYKVRFANNIKAAQSSSSKPPTVKITGIGTFQGSLVKTFTIVPYVLSLKGVSDEEITVTTTDLLYSAGKPRYSKVSVKVGSKVLVKDVDYTLSYANVTQVADVDDPNPPTVTITGKGNYSGSLERNYRIYAKDIGTMSYSKITSLIYTGKELKPSLMIKDKAANTVLVEGTDYTITYTKNTSVGTGSAIITGIGTYGGTKKIRFVILPKIFKWFF